MDNELDDYNWIAHPDGKGNPENDFLIANRSKLKVHADIDLGADYEYDMYAIVSLDDKYFLLNSSGCSCPSPSETWGINLGPVTKDELVMYLRPSSNNNFLDKDHKEVLDNWNLTNEEAKKD